MKKEKVFKVLGTEDLQFIAKKGSLLSEKELVVIKGGRDLPKDNNDCPIKAASDRLS